MINRQSLILKKSYLCICMKQFLYSRSRIIESLIHIIGWGIVFAFPFVMMTRGGFDITLVEYLRHGSIVPLSFLIVFYTNYCFLIPRYCRRTHQAILLLNIVLIVCTPPECTSGRNMLSTPTPKEEMKEEATGTSEMDIHHARLILHDTHRRTKRSHPP